MGCIESYELSGETKCQKLSIDDFYERIDI